MPLDEKSVAFEYEAGRVDLRRGTALDRVLRTSATAGFRTSSDLHQAAQTATSLVRPHRLFSFARPLQKSLMALVIWSVRPPKSSGTLFSRFR